MGIRLGPTAGHTIPPLRRQVVRAASRGGFCGRYWYAMTGSRKAFARINIAIGGLRAAGRGA